MYPRRAARGRSNGDSSVRDRHSNLNGNRDGHARNGHTDRDRHASHRYFDEHRDSDCNRLLHGDRDLNPNRDSHGHCDYRFVNGVWR